MGHIGNNQVGLIHSDQLMMIYMNRLKVQPVSSGSPLIRWVIRPHVPPVLQVPQVRLPAA